MRFLRFQPKLGHAVIHCQCSRICLNLPKLAKICPKTISLRNSKMPPKIEILVFFKNKKQKLLCVEEALECMFTVWISNIIIFICLFYCQKTAFVCEFQHTPLRKMIFFSMFHTSCVYEILEACT
jgi:hypothetical protein